MLIRVAALGLLAGLAVALQAADKDADYFEIVIKFDRKEAPGTVDKPTVISNAAQLAQAIPEKDIQGKLAKEIDFKTHKLLFFVWTGSGSDKLTPKAEKGKVVFQYHPGVTDDVARHFKLFALAKDLSWQVAK